MHRVVIEKLDQVKIFNDKNTDANNMGSIILVWHENGYSELKMNKYDQYETRLEVDTEKDA